MMKFRPLQKEKTVSRLRRLCAVLCFWYRQQLAAMVIAEMYMRLKKHCSP